MELIKLLQDYIDQGELIKNKTPKYWKPEYDDIITELKEIIDFSKINSDDAGISFNNLAISRYKTFGDYIKSVDINASKVQFTTHHKIEKRKLICRHCSSTQIYLSKEGVYICKKCGSEIQHKINTQLLAKETIDTSKHIVKQLNTLIGKINTPSSLNKILPYLKKWFLNRHYIRDYLNYVGKLETWIEKYNKLSTEPLKENYFDEKIEAVPDSLCGYKIFKLYTDTFYEMTDLIRTYNLFTNNMNIIDEALVLEICQSYYDEFKKIPDENEIYEYKKSKYEIGKYIVSMLITDPNCETEFKQNLNKIFNTTLKLPGLMFDFKKIYGSENIPKKFTYQQNYIFIIHDIYNIPYYNIIESDKQIICDIMMSFNNYVKEIKSKQSGKNHNSCLWQISLLYVFELPWFRCYRDIIKILPIKINNTTSNIGELWVKFKIAKHDYISKYTNTIRKEIVEKATKTKIVTTKQIDEQGVLDFINKAGSCYGGDNDRYLRNKHNIQEAKHDWVEGVDMLLYNGGNSKENEEKKQKIKQNQSEEEQSENQSEEDYENEFENEDLTDDYEVNSEVDENEDLSDDYENDYSNDYDDY